MREQAGAARAHSRADGHFALTSSDPDQQDIGDIHAGKQQHDHGEGEEESGNDHDEIVRQRHRVGEPLGNNLHADAFFSRGILVGEPRDDEADRTLRLSNRYAGFQTTHHDPLSIIAGGPHAWIVDSAHANRKIDVHV